MRNDTNYNYITETATKAARRWSNADILSFHYFNPNGLITRKRANDEAIAKLVDAGVMKGGAHFAYGSLANYEADAIRELWNAKRPGNIETRVAVKMLREHCEKVEAVINEHKGA